jgi:hypothetical protein
MGASSFRSVTLLHATDGVGLTTQNTFSTPAGMPARCASSASARADKGVCSAGWITAVQPAASAGATLRVIIAIGKFHGYRRTNAHRLLDAQIALAAARESTRLSRSDTLSSGFCQATQ